MLLRKLGWIGLGVPPLLALGLHVLGCPLPVAGRFHLLAHGCSELRFCKPIKAVVIAPPPRVVLSRPSSLDPSATHLLHSGSPVDPHRRRDLHTSGRWRRNFRPGDLSPDRREGSHALVATPLWSSGNRATASFPKNPRGEGYGDGGTSWHGTFPSKLRLNRVSGRDSRARSEPAARRSGWPAFR